MSQYLNDTDFDLIEKVIRVNRSSKVVKGGRRFSFSALVVVGDGNGSAGLGFGKANEVSEAIRKALEDAKKNIKPVALYGTTIPFAVTGKYKGGCVLLKPATSGTGIIAGGAVRAVMEAVGIKDILSKSLGSNNKINVAKATMTALESLITKEEAFKKRGIIIKKKNNTANFSQPENNSDENSTQLENVPAELPAD